MKKVMAIVILTLLAGASFANAQGIVFTGKLLNPDKTGPFTVATTEQRDTGHGGKVFINKVKTIGGGEARFDLTIDGVTGNLISMDMWGYTKQQSDPSPILRHILTCSSSDFRQIATWPDDPMPFPHIENLRGVALCAFNPNGIDGTTDGIAYLHMSGASKKLTDAPAAIEKFTFSGTVGGAYNGIDDNLVFKGSFATVLKPLTF